MTGPKHHNGPRRSQSSLKTLNTRILSSIMSHSTLSSLLYRGRSSESPKANALSSSLNIVMVSCWSKYYDRRWSEQIHWELWRQAREPKSIPEALPLDDLRPRPNPREEIRSPRHQIREHLPLLRLNGLWHLAYGGQNRRLRDCSGPLSQDQGPNNERRHSLRDGAWKTLNGGLQSPLWYVLNGLHPAWAD